MEILIRAAAAAAVGSVLALLRKKHAPEQGMALSILTGAVIVWLSAGAAVRVTQVFTDLADKGEIPSIYLSPVMKCIGIGLITDLTAGLCRDAQQGGVASAVELCGTLCAVYVSLPLISSLLATVEKLL